MNELDDRIGRYLRGQAETLELTPASPGRAVRRAQQRRARRRLGGVAAVGLAAVLVGNQVAGTTSGGADVVADQMVAFDGPALTWQRVDPASPDAALGYNTGIVSGADGLYSLSTAPGRHVGDGPVPQALYRSSDGIDWTTDGNVADGTWLGRLTSADGTLYALSTGAGLAEGVAVSASADGGVTWDPRTLPLDLAAVEAVSSRVYLSATSVAAGTAGVVATVRVAAEVDASVLSAGTDAPNGVRATAGGVEVLGPVMEGGPLQSHQQCDGGTVVVLSDEQRSQFLDASGAPAMQEAQLEARRDAMRSQLEGATYGCQWSDGDVQPIDASTVSGPPIETIRWDTLDVSDDVQLAATNTLRVFTSSDGVTFTEAALPEALSGWGSAQVIATDAGYTLVTQRSTGSDVDTMVLTSADGSTWTTAELPSDGWVMGAGRLGDQVGVVVQDRESAATSLLLGGGSTWAPIALADEEQGLAAVAFGPSGVAAFTNGGGQGSLGVLLTSPDGETWTRTALDEIDGAPDRYLRHLAVTTAGVVLTFDGSAEHGSPAGTESLIGSFA